MATGGWNQPPTSIAVASSVAPIAVSTAEPRRTGSPSAVVGTPSSSSGPSSMVEPTGVGEGADEAALLASGAMDAGTGAVRGVGVGAEQAASANANRMARGRIDLRIRPGRNL